MNPEIVKKFETGSKKAGVNLVTWGPGQIVIQITDGSSNFTSFHVDSDQEGEMKGKFLAGVIQKVAGKKTVR